LRPLPHRAALAWLRALARTRKAGPGTNGRPAESAHEGELDARSASTPHTGRNPSSRLMRVAGISTDMKRAQP